MTGCANSKKRWYAALVSVALLLVMGTDAYAVGNEKKRSSNPLSGDKLAIKEGKVIFRANCAYCHGVRANGRGRGLPNSADLRKFKRGYTNFVDAVKNGRKTMPPWGGMGEITDEQIDQVGAYLETLAVRGAKWKDPDKQSKLRPESGAPSATFNFAWLLPAIGNALIPAAHAAESGHQVHLDHILKAFSGTPEGVGLATILEQEAEIARQHAALAIQDLENLDNIQLHTRHVRHAVAPGKEANADGPGKGYGVMTAAMGIVEHTEMARDASGAPDAVKTHAEHVLTSANNIVYWSGKILDKAGQITGGASPVASAFFAEEIVTHIQWILHGRDADNDGTVSWTEGEGGLAQVRQHIGYMQ